MKKSLILLIVILILAGFVRIFKVSQVPPSLNWDEASIGYDVWSILQDGKDQWGEHLPFIFRSFGEFKFPTHIYATALSISIFGLSDFGVRFPSVLLGIVNVFLLYFLSKRLTGNVYIGLLSSFFLAISPWHIQFSRINWETNFVLFVFFTATIIFLRGIEDKVNKLLIPIAYILFGLTIYTYNAAKIFIPIYILFLTTTYFKSLIKRKLFFYASLSIFIVILGLGFLNTKLSGSVRFKQVDFSNDWIVSTYLYKLTNNRYISRIELIAQQYISHFSPEFLFISGDKNPRHSSQYIGQIYIFDGLFILLGLIFLLRRRKKEDLLLLVWFFISPIPASIVKEAPHASRAMFALGGWQTISAVGFYYLYSIIKKRIYAKTFLISVFLIIGISFFKYFYQYLNYYPIKYSQEWQYGYKKLFSNYRNEFPKYNQVLISDEYAQPYIFALYYLKYNPKLFREEVKYNMESNWGFSTVSEFGQFKFGKIEDLLKQSNGKILVFATNKEKLDKQLPKGTVDFLDGSVAFWVYEL